jgi:hypothetical protein
MNFIRFRNGPTKVTLIDGTVIQKSLSEWVFVPEYMAMIKRCPYDNHYLFEMPKKIKGPSYLCSCGAAGIFVGSRAYLGQGSPEGLMLVCQSHIETGKHNDGSS